MKYVLVLVCYAFVSIALAVNPVVVFETNHGNFEAELDAEKAPITVQNFLDYVKDGFYNQTLVHRVVKNFVIQGGGLDLDFKEKVTRPPIQNEAGNGLSNLKGTLGMARTPEIHSADSQFFINTKNNTGLDHKDNTPQGFGYAVFGKVISGYDIIEKIENVAVQDVGEYGNVPVDPVVILSVRVK